MGRRGATVALLGTAALLGACVSGMAPADTVPEPVFGQVTAVGADGAITIRRAQLFTDEAAASAAAEDGQPLPNPVYVRDLHRSVTVTVTQDATVVMFPEPGMAAARTLKSASVPEFLARERMCVPDGTCAWFWFEVAGTTVTRITEEAMP